MNIVLIPIDQEVSVVTPFERKITSPTFIEIYLLKPSSIERSENSKNDIKPIKKVVKGKEWELSIPVNSSIAEKNINPPGSW